MATSSARLDFVGDLPDGATVTPQGGLAVRSAVTRVGVFTYVNTDGTTRNELRHPDDVFEVDSLATLRGAPIVLGHPAVIDSTNWKQFAIGNVGDEVGADGGLVVGLARINDAAAVAAIQAGGLQDFSCGYSCDYDPTPGVYDGIPYDGRQTNIRYNHVGLGPSGWGRAGSTVGLQLDSSYDTLMGTPATTPATPEATAKADDSKARLDAAQGREDALTSRLDAANAKVAELEAALVVANDPSRLDGLVAARLALLDSARNILGAEFKADGKSDRDVRIAAIVAVKSDFKADGRSDDYVTAYFDSCVPNAVAETKAVAEVRTVVDSATEVTDPVEAARKRNAERNANAWKKA